MKSVYVVVGNFSLLSRTEIVGVFSSWEKAVAAKHDRIEKMDAERQWEGERVFRVDKYNLDDVRCGMVLTGR